MRWTILLAILLFPVFVGAKKVKYRKVQEVNFDGTAIDGEARAPDGAYLHQRRGIKFMPLYKVNKQFDKDIKESVEHLE